MQSLAGKYGSNCQQWMADSKPSGAWRPITLAAMVSRTLSKWLYMTSGKIESSWAFQNYWQSAMVIVSKVVSEICRRELDARHSFRSGNKIRNIAR
jgi:hypothetical protein